MAFFRRFWALLFLLYPVFALDAVADSAGKPQEELYYSLEVKGAENIGVMPGDVSEVTVITDTPGTIGESAFVFTVANKGRNTFAADTSEKRLFSRIPPQSDTALKTLESPIYAVFHNKNEMGGQTMVLCENARRLSLAAAYSALPVFKVSKTQWVKKGQEVRLVFYTEPAAMEKASPVSPIENLRYSLQVKGAERNNISPDDVTHVAILTDNTTGMGESLFVKQAAEKKLGELSGIFSGIPPVSNTERSALGKRIYAGFQNKRGDGTLFMEMGENLHRLSANRDINQHIGIFRIAGAQWMKTETGMTLVFYLEPAKEE